jgi:hypothetical protein
MWKFLRIIVLLAFAVDPVFAASSSPPASVQGISSLGGNLNRNRLKFVGRWWGQSYTNGNVGTDYSASSRIAIVLKGAITRAAVFFGQRSNLAGAEGGSSMPANIVRGTFENANAVIPFLAGGAQDFVVPGSATGAGVRSDTVGFPSAAGSTIDLRTFVRVPKPGTSGSASAVAGGSLSVGTFYYKITTVDNGLESGGSSEFSGTTSGGNLALQLTWTAPTYGQYINIYRGASTGAERFLAQVPIGQNSYTDTGLITPNSGVSVPTGTAIGLNRFMFANESGNVQYAGGAGTDQTSATGAITGQTGANTTYFPTAAYVVADDYKNPSLLMLGDSIPTGTGIPFSTLLGPYNFHLANWFDKSFSDGQFAGTLNESIGSTKLLSILNGAQAAWFRLSTIQYADYVISDLGINDIGAGTSWSALAAAHLSLAQTVASSGARYSLTTLTPNTTSTDAFLTASNQTAFGGEAQRLLYNAWVRAGCLVDGTGAPVQSGGSPSPLIYARFDVAANIEVNSSNILTQDGGFWIAPSAPDLTGQTLTGSPTTTSLTVGAASYTVPSASSSGLVGKAIKMTSGAANGQVAFIKNNTATVLTLFANNDVSYTGISVSGLTVAPSAGDTFSVYTIGTPDGVHPGINAHTLISTAFSTFLTTNMVAFGQMLGN